MNNEHLLVAKKKQTFPALLVLGVFRFFFFLGAPQSPWFLESVLSLSYTRYFQLKPPVPYCSRKGTVAKGFLKMEVPCSVEIATKRDALCHCTGQCVCHMRAKLLKTTFLMGVKIGERKKNLTLFMYIAQTHSICGKTKPSHLLETLLVHQSGYFNLLLFSFSKEISFWSWWTQGQSWFVTIYANLSVYLLKRG